MKMQESCFAGFLHDDMKAVFLGHLSKENNYEALAYETVCSEVTLGDNPYRSKRFSDSGCETGQYFRCGCIVEEIIYSKETKLYLKYRFSFLYTDQGKLKAVFSLGQSKWAADPNTGGVS